jgi:plastocyanin
VLLKVSDGAGGSAELRKTITVMGDFVEIKLITDQADPLKNYFEPKEVTVKAGTKIRFINVFGPHTATAYRDKIPPGATPFNSGDTVITTVYQPGTACTPANGCYEVVLTVPGTYEYMCIPHEALGMVGKIIVEP